MTYIRRAFGLGYPKSPVPGATAVYEADSGVGVSVGAPVPTWAGSGSSAPVLGIDATCTAPILRLDDDLLPYIEFNGVMPAGGSGLISPLLPAFVGLHLTVFLVVRPHLALTVSGNGNKILALGRAGQISGAGTGTVAIRRTAAANVNAIYEGIGTGGDGSSQTGTIVNVGVWEVFCLRAAVRGSNSFVHLFRSGMTGWGYQFGLVPTPLPARNYSRWSLGFDHPTATDFLRVDFRAYGLYEGVGLSDEAVKSNMRYFAHKWKVPVLD